MSPPSIPHRLITVLFLTRLPAVKWSSGIIDCSKIDSLVSAMRWACSRPLVSESAAVAAADVLAARLAAALGWSHLAHDHGTTKACSPTTPLRADRRSGGRAHFTRSVGLLGGRRAFCGGMTLDDEKRRSNRIRDMNGRTGRGFRITCLNGPLQILWCDPRWKHREVRYDAVERDFRHRRRQHHPGFRHHGTSSR